MKTHRCQHGKALCPKSEQGNAPLPLHKIRVETKNAQIRKSESQVS